MQHTNCKCSLIRDGTKFSRITIMGMNKEMKLVSDLLTTTVISPVLINKENYICKDV